MSVKMGDKKVVVNLYIDRSNNDKLFLCESCHTRCTPKPMPLLAQYIGEATYTLPGPVIRFVIKGLIDCTYNVSNCACCGVDFSTLIPDIESPYESEAIDGVDLSSDADKELDCTESDKCVNCKHFTYFRLDPYCNLQQRAVEPGDVCGAHERLRLLDK